MTSKTFEQLTQDLAEEEACLAEFNAYAKVQLAALESGRESWERRVDAIRQALNKLLPEHLGSRFRYGGIVRVKQGQWDWMHDHWLASDFRNRYSDGDLLQLNWYFPAEDHTPAHWTATVIRSVTTGKPGVATGGIAEEWLEFLDEMDVLE